jgi:membrane fusion protein, adhesin transport system
MNRFSLVEQKYPLPAWRMFGWMIILLIIAFIVWAYFTEFEEVAVFSGEVVPQDKVKVIQHLEGGIIDKVFIREGITVQAGDPLMQLDLAVNAINEEALLVQLDGLLIKRARLVGESEGTKPVYPEATSTQINAVLEAEKKVHAARNAESNSIIAILKDKALQKKLDVDQLRLKIVALGSDLKLTEQKFSMSKQLLESNLTSKIDHLQLNTELSRLQNELKIIRPALPRAKSAASEAKRQISKEKLQFRLRAQEELSDVEREIARLKEVLITAGDQVNRTTIRSPIDGTIKNLRINTIGGIVRPGEAVMDIVPSSDKLVVEAKLSPTDRGFVRVGQDVTVKLTAYDFFIYGGIKGRVTNIAADSTSERNGETYFKTVIEAEGDWGQGKNGIFVSSGMQAVVDVRTGTRPVLQYLLQPVLRLRHESFRER